MASQGPNNGSTFANVAGAGVDWVNPSNAQTSDNSYATALLTNTVIFSDYLRVTGFGFTVPAGATIDGVQVDIERKWASAKGVPIVDLSVMLVKGGTESGNDKADTGTNWPSSDTYASYGGAADLWGLTLTDSDINASNFGVSISAQLELSTPPTPPFSATGSIDHIRITVHYTEATGVKRTITITGAGR